MTLTTELRARSFATVAAGAGAVLTLLVCTVALVPLVAAALGV
jgi:hypothetical protein